MKGEWEETKLADVSADVAYGYTESASDEKIGPRFLRITDIQNGVVDWNTVPYCPISESDHQKYRLHPGDIVVARTGNSTGENYLYRGNEDAVYASYLIRFRVNQSAADPAFVWYNMRTQRWQEFINSSKTGSAQAGANAKVLGLFPLPLPPLPEQRAIASVLGALDDKIELNRRMNATLEAMARALFQSWFVDFDPVRAKLDGRPPAALDPATAALFPEHLEDSPLGHIPKGWTAQRLPDAIEVNPRRTLKTGTIAPYLDMKNLPTQGHSAEEVIDREFSSGTKFQNGDTLLARITPCLENGKTGYVDFLEDGQVGWGSTEYIVLAPRPPLPPQFGYLLARSDALRTHAIQNMTGTSGRQRVPSECFNTFWLAVPPPSIARRFDELTAPLMAKIKANSTESRTLAALRDTLLPKLLSGEVSVGELEN
jgi:type I restriction enzyme S subunit